MARDRSDTRWQNLPGAWARLRWARETAGPYPSAASFARAIKEKEHTYSAYERDPDTSSKATDLVFERAVAWADKLDVQWEWLLKGEGLPWRDARPLSPDARRVGAMLDEHPEDERAALAQAIERLLKRA